MAIPPEFRPLADELPPALRALLDAELAAGNRIVRHDRSHPTPPISAFLELDRRVTTRPRASGDGLTFHDFSKFGYPGSFTDDREILYLLEPFAPELELDMNAIRDAHNSPPSQPPPARHESETALARFERSMVIDYQKWHDGIGYDMDTLRAATAAERGAIESILLRRGAQDWRDVEALAALDTPRASAILKAALESPDAEIRMAVSRHAPQLVPDATRVRSLVQALETATFTSGLTPALDEIAEFHPPEVVDALLRGALHRDGTGAVHFAAMLMFIHGQAKEPFDWDQRPFFLRFNTASPQDRAAVFRELCRKIEVDPSKYL